MTATIIDGKALAARVRGEVAEHVKRIGEQTCIVPGLAVVLVGDDPASQIYVRSKIKHATAAGMKSFEHRLPANTGERDLLRLVERLNTDPDVHGILVQLPLPEHLDPGKAVTAVAPAKDVDGFHYSGFGFQKAGTVQIVPCTPLGCLRMLREHHPSLSGMDAIIIGRSNIVGKPMAMLLLEENCTVTVAHSRTRNLPDTTRRADIVVAAVGRPEMIKGNWIKHGATVIDVGINRVERAGAAKLVGDVEFDTAREIAGAITPVPGGVGPMTIACLLANTVTACCHANGLNDPSLAIPQSPDKS